MYAALTSGLGLYFLARCADKVGGRNASFSSLSKLTWPKLGIFFDLAIAIKCFGVAVSYLIIMGDLMPQVSKKKKKYDVHTDHTHKLGHSVLFS